MPYGDREVDEQSREFTDQPTDGVGLLFMNYQRSIEGQFEFVQQAMANAPDFPAPGTGIDPITGQGVGPTPHWPVEWGGARTRPFDFAGYVTLRGGEYFFAPCLSFLRGL
jgi:deferrochelatase/peroxidase EfeB